MADFELNERLREDCVLLAEWNDCLLLLMNNSMVPWFILVPKTNETELYAIPATLRVALENNINHLSKFILNEFDVTKLNVATIGNVVSQLHVHVIGRSPSDYCWPDVVWGKPGKKIYTEDELESIKTKVKQILL